MSGRGPDPKDLRASLVDSGWSVAPPPAEPLDVRAPHADEGERPLPNYDDASHGPAVTQIDDDIQSRLRDMQRASIGDSHRPHSPAAARPSRPPPPSLPPPPAPSLPPPPLSDAPLPSFRTPSSPDEDLAATPGAPGLLPAPIFRGPDSEPAEATAVGPRPQFLPPSDPPELRAPPVPMLSLPAAPSLLSALRQRVQFAGGEVPLWSLIVPVVVLLVLASGFVAAAASRPDTSEHTAASTSASATLAAPSPSSNAAASAAEAAGDAPGANPQAPALPVASNDAEALEARRAEELSKDEALALASAHRERDVKRVADLRKKLARDPGLFKDAATLTELRRAAEDPLTAADALSAMAEAPGPLSADLLYEMWTGTVVRNSATELARSLVFSKEVRAKASPELAVALELRIADSCQQNQQLLPRVTDKGDRRSLALLAKLSRRFGCGPNKHVDCYPCLRGDKAVEDAMVAVKKRREPKPFLGAGK